MAGVTHLMGKFAWLADEPGPKMLTAALKLLGIQEKAGASDNPTILAWAKDLGIEAYKHDATPWCGLFVAYVAHKAGKPVVKDPLWAKNWLNWGSAPARPQLGDVLVFSRSGGGHVGLYVAEDEFAYYTLGGNQGDAVSIARVSKRNFVGARRFYAVGVPANVRAVWIGASGALEKNLA